MMEAMRLVHVPSQRKHKYRVKLRYVFVALLVFIGAAFGNTLRPLPDAALAFTLPGQQSAEQLKLAWPSKGEAAIAAEDYGMLASYGSDTPMATASIAKVITALCVLEQYPLQTGETGPIITFSKQDAALYQYQILHGGSRVPVYDGEQMTEYEALEAMLIPSANNVADSLATWAFGSLDAYGAYANNYLLQHGLVKTHVGVDASGLDPSTTSTASDLTQLGLLARENPVLMSIVGKKSVTLPGIGTYTNYNTALGTAGINGFKTGNNEQNKGALLFTGDLDIDGQTVRISGTVMGQDSLQQALDASVQLMSSISQNFSATTYLTARQQVGTATTAWGEAVPIIAKSDAKLLRWNGDAVTIKKTVHSVAADKKAEVGAVAFSAGQAQTSITLELGGHPKQPSLWWKVTRIL